MIKLLTFKTPWRAWKCKLNTTTKKSNFEKIIHIKVQEGKQMKYMKME